MLAPIWCLEWLGLGITRVACFHLVLFMLLINQGNSLLEHENLILEVWPWCMEYPLILWKWDVTLSASACWSVCRLWFLVTHMTMQCMWKVSLLLCQHVFQSKLELWLKVCSYLCCDVEHILGKRHLLICVGGSLLEQDGLSDFWFVSSPSICNQSK